MKYLLPLVLLASAAWATQHEPRSTFARSVEQAREPREQANVPWLNPALAAQVAAVVESDPHTAVHGHGDPHRGSYADGDPHAGLYDGAELGDSCPHVASTVLAGGAHAVPGGALAERQDEDPHASTRAPAGALLPPRGIARSSAQNGHTIAELYARRDALAEQAVRVRGVVVKRTDGILGQSYLHLQDGTGSAAGQDHDLTVTTTEEFAVGDTVELQGLVRVDQDLGLGYRYALLLTAATDAEKH